MTERSKFANTPLFEYVYGNDRNVKDRDTKFRDAVAVFENESYRSFDITFDANAMSRIEPLRLFIVKVLLSLGVIPRNNAFAVVARLIELLVVHPELSMNEIIADFDKSHSTDKHTVSNMIDKCFNVYDDVFMKKVTAITESSPNTAKDVLCDLAVCINAKYRCDPISYE